MLGNLLIFGDSYSTFGGFIPEGYRTYYSVEGRPDNPVTKMQAEQTWWKRVIAQTGANLILNNSWSGSTICYTSLTGEDCSKTNSFIYRYRQLKQSGFFEKNSIDTIFIFGATNDNWGQSPVGEPKYSDWTEQDLYYVLPAISHFIYSLRKDLPNTRIIYIINTKFKPEIMDCIQTSAKLYGIETIALEEVDKQLGHPTVKGMQEISEQVLTYLNKSK